MELFLIIALVASATVAATLLSVWIFCVVVDAEIERGIGK